MPAAPKMERDTIIPPVENPREWSARKKVRVTLVLGAMVLSFTYLSTAFALSSNSLQRQFNASAEVVTLGLSLYVLGFALGPLLMGPLAQTNGKRPVYVVSWILFTACCFIMSESHNLPVILTFRLISSIAGSSALNNVPASYSDMTTPSRFAPFFACYGFSAFAGPALGGLVGAFVNERAGWQWNLRHQAIFVAVVTIFGVSFVPETDHPKLKRLHDAKYAVHPEQDSLDGKAKVAFASRISSSTRSFANAVVTSIKLPFQWLFTGEFAPVKTLLGAVSFCWRTLCSSVLADQCLLPLLATRQIVWFSSSLSTHPCCTRSSTTSSSSSLSPLRRFVASSRNRSV